MHWDDHAPFWYFGVRNFIPHEFTISQEKNTRNNFELWCLSGSKCSYSRECISKESFLLEQLDTSA